MKKNVVIFILLFLIMPLLTFAGESSDDGVAGTTMIRATCVYKNSSNYSEFDFSGISAVAGGPFASLKAYHLDNAGNSIIDYKVEDANSIIVNYNRDFGVKFAVTNHMFIVFDDNDTNEDTLDAAIKGGKFCPSTVYEIKNNDSREYMFCNGYNEELGVNTCTEVENYIKSNYSSDYTYQKQPFSSSKAISNNGQSDMSQTDVKEEYVQTENEIKDVCNEDSDKYDKEKCAELKETSSTLVDQAEDQGISEKELKTYMENLYKLEINGTEIDCSGLLGNPKNEGEPAFYLQIIFNVMKYVAIIILILFSMMDYFGAIFNHDNDAIKKATSKLIQRLLICVVLFLFPYLLEYIFTWINVYNPSTCGIR